MKTTNNGILRKRLNETQLKNVIKNVAKRILKESMFQNSQHSVYMYEEFNEYLYYCFEKKEWLMLGKAVKESGLVTNDDNLDNIACNFIDNIYIPQFCKICKFVEKQGNSCVIKIEGDAETFNERDDYNTPGGHEFEVSINPELEENVINAADRLAQNGKPFEIVAQQIKKTFPEYLDDIIRQHGDSEDEWNSLGDEEPEYEPYLDLD